MPRDIRLQKIIAANRRQVCHYATPVKPIITAIYINATCSPTLPTRETDFCGQTLAFPPRVFYGERGARGRPATFRTRSRPITGATARKRTTGDTATFASQTCRNACCPLPSERRPTPSGRRSAIFFTQCLTTKGTAKYKTPEQPFAAAKCKTDNGQRKTEWASAVDRFAVFLLGRSCRS